MNTNEVPIKPLSIESSPKLIWKKICSFATNVFWRVRKDFEHAQTIEQEITARKREQILKLARQGIDVSRFY